MSVVAALLALTFASQVQSAKERYPAAPAAPVGTAPAASSPNQTNQAAPAGNTAPANQNSSRVPPPPPAATGQASPATSPYNRGLPSNAGTLQPLDPTGSTSPPPATSSDDESPYRRPLSQGSAAATPSTGIKPSAMIKLMLTPPAGSQLSGSPVSLVEVVSGSRSRQDQAHRVEAYWDLCSSVADYYLSVREQDERRQLRASMPRAGDVLQQAEPRFAVRLDTSKQAAIASQRRLGSMIGRGGSSLPLPGDLPHCGSYQTFYERVFASRPSVEARELATLLPLRYSELKESAAAISRTQEWVSTVARNESGDGSDTLRALELFALQRRGFVQIARDYNRRIARYAELSAPGDIDAEGLVRMLIKRDETPTATRPSLPSGIDGRRSEVSPPATRQTFASGQTTGTSGAAPGDFRRDDSVQPASGSENTPVREERSLLVD